ncbi:lipoprotein insertase outer membrane protein LolB [Polaromonas naphthalenivorans]|uniref:Outer-membrane lipoprotein LolB n=1 Tax=Polaromonas naphthalenivorans (strain CJ2) TaxID=365044 RepID=A1VKP0_POLNA|nr:lipoprotein insertase outer membrane protein LolB [Polaromonas naphthalenivorans]ABM36218.1 putative lipoprotein [Polaromonas naphthalenivorans CJ2]MBH2009648.1 outer membrane lipoprotein LolB [Xanthomonadaceae bacterium]
MHFTERLRRYLLHTCLFATFLIAGCAHPTSVKALKDIKKELWTGRISLLVKSEPEQSFSAGFELKGRSERGELTLISPLGNVLGVLRWSPGEAELDSGNQKIQRFDSVDALMAQATGAAVPLSALFAWLQGDDANVSGWSADLSRQGEGRISARRTQPAPQADLRVVLDQ